MADEPMTHHPAGVEEFLHRQVFRERCYPHEALGRVLHACKHLSAKQAIEVLEYALAVAKGRAE